LADLVVDNLRIDILIRAVDVEPRSLGIASDPLPYPRMALLPRLVLIELHG
jgi:hypothetical protein